MAKSTGHSCMGCLGAAVAAVSLPFMIAAIADVFEGKDIGITLGLGAMFAVMFAASSWFSLKMFKSEPEGTPQLNEAQLLRLAAAHHARLTVSQVVVSTGVSVDVAEEMLEDMTKKRLAEVLVDENGAEVFHFIELQAALPAQGPGGDVVPQGLSSTEKVPVPKQASPKASGRDD